jgi:pimeloyl-ACP methyl ester carboxylesterase
VHEAFFFGSGERRLFANYHPPIDAGRGDLVVVCPPLFAEYMRTHLALRELAITLAERGQHVLRFDYRGTGDSAGELSDVTTKDWVEDIALAIQEGRDLTGVDEVRLVGVRAGGLLAYSAARSLDTVRQLVLWDPVASGALYLESLQRTQADMLKRNRALDAETRHAIADHYAGFALTPRLVAGFRAMCFDQTIAARIDVVHTSPVDAPFAGAKYHLERFDCKWEVDGEDLMMPQPVLERLAICSSEP